MQGIFWAYDGAFKIGTPPRLYNDVLDAVLATPKVKGRPLSGFQLARIYALVNVVIADAGIASWREKYRNERKGRNFFWRPVAGFRNKFTPAFVVEKDWLPLGAPQTNTDKVCATATPDFPAYPSGSCPPCRPLSWFHYLLWRNVHTPYNRGAPVSALLSTFSSISVAGLE
jgi:vanadium chloroperoxidase